MSNNPLDNAKDYFSSASSTQDIKIDEKSQQEQLELFSGKLETLSDWITHETFRLNKKDKESERDLRRKNANRSFWFSLGWAAFIGAFIVVKGFYETFHFSETEYLATIGTLSITILTYYLVVVKSLFPNNKPNNK
ncbi:hypothetical protein [Reichenbachiella sp. MSK19-1]|uniref:hypothetical protein n=1 Tax=Reichenbachiella sp. MSK19-1 TaxID=1897631 RepID=UPI000E6C6E6E|nr:hypothetical protein [Reichenbachiella sp. MSK19-1]RJE71877.1 hypothetical protein BGP76_07260 [Reichenbachiella sp. MSK19-1]